VLHPVARALCLLPFALLFVPVQSVQAALPRQTIAMHSAVSSSSGQPTPAPSPTAAPDLSRPAVTQPAGSPVESAAQTGSPVRPSAAAAAGAGLKREVFGFATSGSLSDPAIGYPSWNFNLLSTVAFFALHFRFDGQLVGDADFTVWSSSALIGLVSTAHAHGAKVVVTIVGPGNPVDQCDALYNDKQSISQLIPQVVAKGVDGVNIDYEGQLRMCQNVVDPTLNATNQTLLTNFAKDLRAALDAVKPGYYLSIDTYSGSASGTDGFFNIPNLNQYVDSFFVMAYDMDYSNQPYAPLSCVSFCMNPVSPLANYYWNDSTSMTQYSAVVGPGKTILGQPYYGRVACVASPVEHAASTGSLSAATYTGAAAVATSTDVKPGTFVMHRDASDPAGMDRWDTWYDNSLGCWREMYWSDTITLATRYQLVNQMNLRGVGFWTLNYGGGSPELWTAIQTYFNGCYSVAVTTSPPSTSAVGTAVTLTASAGCPDANPLYRFSVLAPGASSYQTLQDYSTTSSLTWNTNGLALGGYRFSVWARDANSTGEFGNSAGTWDVYYNNATYNLTACSGLNVSVAPSSPVGIGRTVTVSALASGCPDPNPVYHFAVLAPGATSYQMVQDYSTSATFVWNTTGMAPGTYRFSVWARDAAGTGAYGNSSGRWDTYNNNAMPTLTTCSAVGVSAAPGSPVGVGRTVTLNAQASGCPNPNPLYRFMVLAPGATSYTVVQDYVTSPTFTWNTTGLAPGTYRFSVWARDASSSGAYGNSSGRWDVYNNNTVYTLSTCSALNLTVSPASPKGAGTTVTLTASASGCPNPNPVYHFAVLKPGATSYAVVQDYSTSRTFTWNTTGLAPGTYRFSIWARDAGSSGAYSNASGAWDVYNNSVTFTIS
jgi:uncharacterized protein (DUF2141 family)